MSAERAAIPYAGSTVIGLDAAHFAAIQRTARLLFALAHAPRHQAAIAPFADEVARHAPGNFGVFMGYDFHVTPAGPRLIEINTNAGGALLNGLHTASLCDPEKLACLCSRLLSVSDIESEIASTFRDEFAAVRGAGAKLARIAIVDDAPAQQFLAPEFALFRALFARAGIDARIADTRELAHTPGRGVALGDWPVDLVYLRDTDFQLASERTRALRAAYLANEVVVTPSPREHFLLADKRRLATFSSPNNLTALGMSEDDARFLAEVVPETRLLAELDLERAWAERASWVFKPAAAFGSRAVYRGDKISRKKFAEIAAEPGYVAQRFAQPGLVQVETTDGPRDMKFDVRAYAYRDRVLMLGARVYEGQVTNLRSPGGGFSGICVARNSGC
ncbi:MAG: hypothetical protein FJ091_05935 [Deltaproteobacteria bacterium]|nr:hypothetical protein [Deltaproteobacteria bacterium]